MSDAKKELANLVKILMDSTCTYSALKIHNEKNRFAYVKGVARCYDICMSPEVCEDANKMKVELLKIKKDSIKNLKHRWFNRQNQYYKLGIGHSLDVIDSILTRFEKGYSNSDEYFVRSLLKGIYYGNES